MLFHKHSGSYNGTSCGSGSYYRILRYIQIRLLSLLHNCWIFGTPAILAWSAHGSSRCMHCPMDFLFLNTIALFLPFLLCIDCLCTALLDRCEAPEEPARFFVVLPFPHIRRLPLFPMSATMSKLWSSWKKAPLCLSNTRILLLSIYTWCPCTRHCPVRPDQSLFSADYAAVRQIPLVTVVRVLCVISRFDSFFFHNRILVFLRCFYSLLVQFLRDFRGTVDLMRFFKDLPYFRSFFSRLCLVFEGFLFIYA